MTKRSMIAAAYFLNGAQGQNRTADTWIFNPLLYRLSYLGTGRDGLLGDGPRPVQRQGFSPRQGHFPRGLRGLGPPAGRGWHSRP